MAMSCMTVGYYMDLKFYSCEKNDYYARQNVETIIPTNLAILREKYQKYLQTILIVKITENLAWGFRVYMHLCRYVARQIIIDPRNNEFKVCT